MTVGVTTTILVITTIILGVTTVIIVVTYMIVVGTTTTVVTPIMNKWPHGPITASLGAMTTGRPSQSV